MKFPVRQKLRRLYRHNVKDKSRHKRARGEYMTLILIRLLCAGLGPAAKW
jgi:hypothetical protein